MECFVQFRLAIEQWSAMNSHLNPPVALLGGTFDPVHNGHLALAKLALETLQCTSVQFIPNRVPPHRPKPIATTAQRCDMLRRALADQANFTLNTVEVDRPGPSFMIDTLHLLQTTFANTPLCLLLGVDAFNQLSNWQNYSALLHHCHLILFNRPGYTITRAAWAQQLLTTHQTENVQTLQQQRCGKIYHLTELHLAVSATAIRQQLQQSPSHCKDIPDAVLAYIQQHHLY